MHNIFSEGVQLLCMDWVFGCVTDCLAIYLKFTLDNCSGVYEHTCCEAADILFVLLWFTADIEIK